MPRNKHSIESGLRKKGFEEGGGDHNYFVYRRSDGKKTLAKTKTSHGGKDDIGDGLLGQMAQQCFLTKKQFFDLIDCPLSREEYEKLLKAKDPRNGPAESVTDQAQPATNKRGKRRR
jgi:hypothetical protein